MSAVNNEYSVIDQSPRPQEPLYHLFVKLITSPSFESAKELYWTLYELSSTGCQWPVLTPKEIKLMDLLFVLLNVLQYDRHLNPTNPLWTMPLRLAQSCAEDAGFSPKCAKDDTPVKKTVYVLRRLEKDPMTYAVFATDSPLYTEQAFPNRGMAELALYRNQPFANVYDNYVYNTEYGASAPKYYRRLV